MKHIPTLEVIYYKDSESYTYRYDDEKGITQENGMFTSVANALGDAALNVKSFTFIGIEEA